MVRKVSSMYGVWLAGYYDDFNSARAIPDDNNYPNISSDYSILASHFGNPMNGEATLNPRYRFSIADRNRIGSYGTNFLTTTDNQYLKNNGLFEWLSYDTSRQKPEKWEGRAQLQYPDGHVANRYEFNTVSSEDYLLLSNGYDTLGKYYIPTGDNDSTLGRTNMKSFYNSGGTTNYASKVAGEIIADGDFMQRGHLVGTWMGETLGESGTWDATSTTPQNLFAPVVSPSGQPFLAIQTYRSAYNSSSNKPTLIYKGSLNSRLDGDTFTARIAARAFNGATTNNGKIDLNLLFELGFESSDFPTGSISNGFGGNPAISKIIDLDSGSTIEYDALGLEYIGNNTAQNVINDDTWIDFDFVMNYTAQTYDVYINGQKKITGTAFDETRTAENMYGFQLTLQPKSGSSSSTTLMVDRVGLVRYLTDAEDYSSYETPIQSLKITYPLNGFSTANLEINDMPNYESGGTENLNLGMRKQDYLLNLKSIFSSSTPVDWSLLVFGSQNPRIDRPVWRGVINTMSIKQKGRDRSIDLNATDNISLLDRQVPLWEIGQKGINDSENAVTEYWLYDAQGFKSIMNLGTLPLKVLSSNIGFDVDDSYEETSNQRMQLGSSHPIQMYNNESEKGPNSLEEQYEGINVDTFHETLITGTKRTTIEVPSGHGYTTSSNITITGSNNFNASGINPVFPVGTTSLSFSQSDLPFGASQIGNGSIIYAGKYTGVDFDTSIPNSITGYGNWQILVASQFPKSTDPTSEYVTFFFDADPALSSGDVFYVNKLTIGSATETTQSGRHVVASTKKTLNYFNVNTLTSVYMWCVTTKTTYTGGEFGTYTSNTGLKTLNDRKEWTSDKGVITPAPSAFTAAKYRTLHARWMRDLPNSLWFQYHYGNIKETEIGSCDYTGIDTTNYKWVQITSALYTTLSNAGKTSGVAQIKGKFSTNSHMRYQFIYQGIQSSGGNYYLVGCKYIDYVATSVANLSGNFKVDILDISNDYKHLWLLWADMRNNGKADADGSFRKKDFGLQYPTSENYDVSLYYVDQTDTNGDIDKFASLKVGEDINIWNVDATNEPVSGAAFSKTPDYSLGEEVSSFTYGANQLVIEGLTESRYTVGSYATVYNSLHYDGTYQIASISGTSNITLKGVTAGTNTNAAVGNIMVAPAAASEKELDTKYHDWEDKAGSFLVIDSSPFFNLNTLVNKGTTGQISGGNTNLGDYVATVHGFPSLIDNYYAEAISSYKSTATPYQEHPNTRRLLSDVTFADEGLFIGDAGIPVEDTTNFSDRGTGLIQADLEGSDDTQELYFCWTGKLSTAVSNTAIEVDSSDSPSYPTPNTTLTKSGETFVTKGVTNGMVIKNTTNTTRHNILSVVDEDTIIVSGTWTSDASNTDDYTIPVQLSNVYITSATTVSDSLKDTPSELETFLWSQYVYNWVNDNSNLGVKTSIRIAGTTIDASSIAVHTTVSSTFMLRLLMNVKGDVKSENSGSFYDSDKFRLLWSAALMDSWLPKTRLSCAFDINNIPITSNMTTDGTTTNNDTYGSTVDSRTKTILSTINDIRSKSGFGSKNGLKTTFSYLVGRDGRIEYRPKYNSGLVFTRENLKISDLKTQVAGQITNVRVYYNNSQAFVDYPATNLTDTTRWKVLEYPNITSSIEAESVAKKTYNQNQETRMSITAEPILEGATENKMIDSGRFGYISDPQIALQGYGDYDSGNTNKGNSWTRLGTGGVLFSGMTNGLDGNMKTSTDIHNRHGNSAFTHTASDVAWGDNYYWYGSKSLSYALQVVHVPNFTPKISSATGESLRVFISLKTQTSTIDDCEFTIHLADYSFANDRDKAPTLAANQATSKDVKRSGFYEIDIPSGYGAVANAKIVVSFNAEYCRALLRHRCGDPDSANILKNANSIQGITLTTGNVNSIFPLGGREYSEMFGGFTVERNEWYAPRINITNDLSYIPATFVSYTDAGIGLDTATTLTIQEVSWDITASKKENVSFKLERDESLRSGGVMGYLFPTDGKTRQVGNQDSRGYVPAAPEQTTTITPPITTPSQDINQDGQKPEGGADDNGKGGADRLDFDPNQGINKISKTAYGNIKGRMSLINDNLSHNSKFSILGQQKPPKVPSILKGIEGMDVDISAASGNASVTSDGYALAGKGRVDLLNESATTTTFESTLQTEFVIPVDVIDKSILIQGEITHAAGSTLNKTAILYTTVTVQETGESVSNTCEIKTNTENRITELIPQTILTGLESGNKLTVKITRKAATGNDNSDRNSVILKNIDVKLNRATAPVRGTSNSFGVQ